MRVRVSGANVDKAGAVRWIDAAYDGRDDGLGSERNTLSRS